MILDLKHQGASVARGAVPVRRISTRTQEDHVGVLRCMVNTYRGNQVVRDKAIDIVFRQAQTPSKDKRAQAIAIAKWVQKSITYVNEGTETFQTPLRSLTFRFGDCDEFCTLTATLLESIGIQTQIVGLGWGTGHGHQLRHVFCRAILGGRPVPLDASLSIPVETLPDPIAISRDRGDPSPYTVIR